MNKCITIDEFKEEIQSSKSITVSGFRWSGTPQLLLRSIREIFDLSGKPNGLTIVFTSSATDPGIDHLADPKLLSCSFGSYYGSIPQVRQLIEKNLIQGYSLPQGQISLLFREIARGSPGLISKVGMNTYVDPILKGGRLNKRTKKNVVERLNIKGNNYLLYKSIKIDTALLRGTVADKLGNISMVDEPIKTEFLSMAQAVKSCGGKIFVQVLLESIKFLKPSEIDLPAHLVDGYIIANNAQNDHRHTNKYIYNKDFLNHSNQEKKISTPPDPSYKKIIAHKALDFIKPFSNIIIGQGVPELVGVYARKKKKFRDNLFTFMESGVIGGIPERRPDFGVAFGPSSFLTQDNQFVGFNGGHLDMAILSFVEFDQFGNINVSFLGDTYFGCGGYIDICHAVKKIIFVGSFTSKGLEIDRKNEKIKIKQEGKIKKAVKNVKEITFSPKFHIDLNYKVLIITDRCVFRITKEGVVLDEVFDGIDINNDILKNMEFKPIIHKTLVQN